MNQRRKYALTARSLAVCVALIACPAGAGPTTRPAAVLIHLPGIAGELRIDRDLVAGLVAGGVAPAGRIIDWTGPDRGVPALTNVVRHREQARRVAADIARLRATDADGVITLVGHSGGTGVAVGALENLPPGVNVTNLVLLASALSPGYDLSPALRHVTGKAIVLFSPLDNLVLGAGTRALGTYDRVRTDAAGMVGFKTPADADPVEYSKLVQLDYDPKWAALGNGGDHIGVTSGRFARVILAPLITGRPVPTTWPASTRP